MTQRKRLKTLIDYQGRMWTEGRNGTWSCYDDATGKNVSGLPAPDVAIIVLDTDEVNNRK
jgi:hypothetical protein